MLRYIGNRAPIWKVTNRLKVGILRAKQLNKLEQKEDLEILIRFAEWYIKGYNDIAIKRCFLIDRLYILTELY